MNTKEPVDNAYEKGKRDAIKDLSEGKIFLKSVGGPSDPVLEKFYRNNYGLIFVQAGGCAQHIFGKNGYDIREVFFSELEGYNNCVKKYLEDTFGKDFFEKADRAYKVYIRTQNNLLLRCKELIWKRKSSSARSSKGRK